MYHHYNDITTTGDQHSLGRPASLYSTLYQKPRIDDEHGEVEKKMEGTADTNASHGWHQHSNSWNHNNECNSNSKVSPPLTPLPPSSSINSSISNHLSFHPSSSSYRLHNSHESLPSITLYDHIKTNMSSPLTANQHPSHSSTPPSSNTTSSSIAATSNNMMSAYNSPTYFVSPPSTASAYPPSHHYSPYYGGSNNNSSSNHSMPYQSRHSLVARPKLTTTLWEDEGTICYQVDANGICVARRQDNDMINGTKLLNVAGMSRGKRDGILKNEKGRVVVKVGAMHLKGVWITFARAKLLAAQYKIQEILYPLFVDDPSVFLYATALHNPMSNSRMNSLNGYRFNSNGNSNSSPYQQWDRQLSMPNHDHNSSKGYRNVGIHNGSMNNGHGDMYMPSSSQHQQQQDGIDYNKPPAYSSSLSHSDSTYSLYGQHQDSNNSASTSRPRMYFTNELLDDGSHRNQDIKHEVDSSSPYYGHNNKPGTTNEALASPTLSEAGKPSSAFHLPPTRTSGEYDSTSSITSGTTASTSTTNERRASLVMSSSGSRNNSRHHPYMSPGKIYTPSIMSTLQSYRSDYATTSKDDTATTHDMNKPW